MNKVHVLLANNKKYIKCAIQHTSCTFLIFPSPFTFFNFQAV